MSKKRNLFYKRPLTNQERIQCLVNEHGMGSCFGLNYSRWYLCHHTPQEIREREQKELANLRRILRDYELKTERMRD